MSVTSYCVAILESKDFGPPLSIDQAFEIIRTWRRGVKFESKCIQCFRPLSYRRRNFEVCCQTLYLNPTPNYVVRSLTILTPDVVFIPSYLKSKLNTRQLKGQEFLVLPDPIYWQLQTTLIYENTLKAMLSGKYNSKNLFMRIQNAPLNHCSLSRRTQGKESLFRKIGLPKRAEKTARAMIVPAPDLKPNEVVLPRRLAALLGFWIGVNRMPSLSAQNFVALKVVKIWDSHCIGLPGEIWKHLNSDFDGDEVNMLWLLSEAAQIECERILNSEKNMKSFTHHTKLYPTQDALVAYYLDPVASHLSLPDFLRLVYDLEGSQACFDWFDYFRRHYLDVLENRVSFSLCFREFEYFRQVAKTTKNFEKFLETIQGDGHQEMCLEIQIKSGAKGSYYHLYQLIGSVGIQSADGEFIQSSFMDGLTPEEYIVHAKIGHEALIESMIGVWKPGYNYFKLVNCMQNIIVDYQGRLMDGDQVLHDDALGETYYEDVISHQAFDFIFDKFFPESAIL